MKLKELHLHNNKLGYEGVEKLSQELAKPLSKASSKPGNKVLEVLVHIAHPTWMPTPCISHAIACSS